MQLFAQHRDRTDLPPADFAFHLRRLRPLIDLLTSKDPAFSDWYLKGWTVEEALRNRVYQADGQPDGFAVQQMEAEYLGDKPDDSKSIGIWNGRDGEDGAAFSISLDGGDVLTQTFSLDLDDMGLTFSGPRFYRSAAEVIAKVAGIYDPFYVMFGPLQYFPTKRVFEDRPGASWMLYLPHVLTAREVPEARDWIPVIHEGKQKGTILVSVTDAVFSVDNPEHVKVANEIEIRLVNQDLLPLMAQL
jgi:hypothetical protein